MARNSASFTVLSQTTTRFGVLEEARTKAKPPFASVRRSPLTRVMWRDALAAKRAARGDMGFDGGA